MMSLYQLEHKSYLKANGWFESVYKRLPIDKHGREIPWWTYPAINFLEKRIRKDMQVFEYGSGNSTIWWGKRVKKVISCEHELEWCEKMKQNAPSNVEILYFDLVPSGDYSKAVAKYKEQFDVIVVDGRDRVNCARNALNALKSGGVIIWDNSEKEKYREGYKYLLDHKYKQLDFYGMGPINTYGWCTSIFYSSNNCLLI
jgi:hypothetical protein